MNIVDIQISGIMINDIINSIDIDSFLNTLAAVFGIISFLQELLERYREKAWRKILVESTALLATLVILHKISNWSFAIVAVSLFVFGMTFYRRIKQSKQIKANINNKQNPQITDLLADSMEKDYVPRVLKISKIAFKNAEQCLAENRPKEAIRHLNECKEKVKNQVRFATRYADALIMLDNYAGALAKLNYLPENQLRKKRRYKSVMIRKAVCYHGLNRYVDELNCYDRVIASNYKLGKYYFYRGKVKTRLLEIYPYVKAAEKVVLHTYGSKQDFIMSAIADFDKALSYEDKYKAEALSYKGSCCFYLENYQEALELLYESDDLKDDLANNYVYFGLYYYENGNINIAETYLEKGISFNTDNETPYLYLAKINYKNDMYDKAILYASSALSILPSIDECHGIQGDCYKQKNMYVEAIACYTRAIEVKPKANYFQSRALCYYNKEGADYKKAYNDILKAIELNDTDYNRIKAILYKSKIDRAEGNKIGLDELKNLIQPYIEKKKYNSFGTIFLDYGYLNEAEEYYRKAIAYDASDNSAHYNLALFLRDTGRSQKAIEHLKEAIASDSMHRKSFTLLEKCYRDLDDIYNEIAVQSEINNLNKKYLTVNKKNGDVVYQVSKYYEAERYYRLALKYIPNDSATLNNLACTCYYQEKYEDAVKKLENAIAQAGTYYLAYFNLGNCYLRTGKRDLAKKQYLTVLQLAKEYEPAKQMLESMNPSNIRMILDVEDLAS